MREVVSLWLDSAGDEGCQLITSYQHKRSSPLLAPLQCRSSCRWSEAYTYVKIRQIRTNIRAHFLPINHVPAVLGVLAHGAGAVAFVVVVRALFGSECQATDGPLEWGGALHRDVDLGMRGEERQ